VNRRCLLLTLVVFLAVECACAQPGLRAGASRRDITPREPVPLWGHDRLSEGTLDPLYADALVLEASGTRLAIVSMDTGRSPAEASLQRIRQRIQAATGIQHSIIAGSHTHHGPVLELTDQQGKGRFRFDATLRYYRQTEDSIVAAVTEANSRLEPARLATGSVQLTGFNRNRHTKLEPKPSDRELSVLRLDSASGRPLAILVNFAAHPTSIDAHILKFSADYPGALKDRIRRETGAAALFLQSASGDQSTDRHGLDHRAFGDALAGEALKVALSLHPQAIEKPTLTVREQRFTFAPRTNFSNPIIKTAFGVAFFPELVENYIDEYAQGVRPRLTVALLNGDTAFVAASGEFFSSHSIRLKERARLKSLIFAGYANGYHQYFPTIEAVSEGGYGADSRVSPVAVGAGEQLMDTALLWLYQMRGKID
jgi:hypothetical protein